MSTASKFGLLMTGLMIVTSSPCPAADDQSSPEIKSTNYTVGRGDPAKVVNGKPTYWYPTTAALLYRNAQTQFGSWCTATLIGCNTVLTAAHCVADDSDAQNYRVYFQHAGIFDVTGTPAYQAQFEMSGDTGSFEDVAILKLARPVEGIAPQRINEDHEQADGVKGTIVGFGLTSGRAGADYGLKRFGPVVAAACSGNARTKDLVCWNFLGNDSADTCNGDSGGPLLLSENRPSEVVSGVTSGGNLACSAPDHAFDASVFRNSTWIKSAAGADLGHDACGPVTPLPNAENSGKRYQGFSGHLTDLHPTHVFEVEIARTHQLRVSVNLGKPSGVGPDQLITQPQLYIIPGKSTATDRAACSSNVEAQAASCVALSPADGFYTVLLTRGPTTKTADFQLVISVF